MATMVQKLDLDIREHALNILQRLDQMKQDQQHCDFIVSVGDVEFHTHRNILSAGSDYFNAMLTHDTKERQLGKVEMMDVDSECVKICLNYVYTGKAEIPEGKAERLINVAALIQLVSLINSVSQFLKKSLDINTFYATRKIAEMYNLQDLLETCKIFEQENILSLSCEDGFHSEQNVHVVEILNSAPLTEQDKLTICLRWVGNFADRKSDLLDFLKSVNLDEVPEDYLHHILENSPLVENDFELYKIFSASVMRKLKVGGANGNNSYVTKSLILFNECSDRLQHLNPRTNNVVEFHEEEFGEFKQFSAIALNSYIYILSENKAVHRLRFRDKKGKWEKMKAMIECHGGFPPAVSVNGFLYVIGGSCKCIRSAAEKFCPVGSRWVRQKNMPIEIAGAALICLGGFIYGLGGKSQQEELNAFYKFNPQSAKWTELEPMREARQKCGAAAVNQKIYVFGGKVSEDIENISGDTDCYDVTSKQWTRLSPMIESHYLINAHHVSGWIFAVERLVDSYSIEKYDIERDEWQTVELNGTDEFEVYDSVLI